MFREIRNTASFEIFISIKNMALKLNFYDLEILHSIQIIIEYPISITERWFFIFLRLTYALYCIQQRWATLFVSRATLATI